MIFMVGGMDFTTCVVAESYAVNAVDVFQEWTDANYTIHRDLVRTRVEGTLSLHMRTDEDLQKWYQFWNSRARDCRYSVICSVNNTGEEKALTVFLSCNPVHTGIGGRSTLAEFELQITEA